MDKDYYKILDIARNANEQEIKSAYRQLVKRYHPDKNDGDAKAADQFKLVQEAYEILSNPGRRSAYNQQRWYWYSDVKHQEATAITGIEMLQRSKKLNRYLASLNMSHINRKALHAYLRQLLSETNLQILVSENDNSTSAAILQELFNAMQYLPYTEVLQFSGRLSRLAAADEEEQKKIAAYLKNQKSSYYWNRYLPVIVLLTAMVLCLFIYLVSNS